MEIGQALLKMASQGCNVAGRQSCCTKVLGYSLIHQRPRLLPISESPGELPPSKCGFDNNFVWSGATVGLIVSMQALFPLALCRRSCVLSCALREVHVVEFGQVLLQFSCVRRVATVMSGPSTVVHGLHWIQPIPSRPNPHVLEQSLPTPCLAVAQCFAMSTFTCLLNSAACLCFNAKSKDL